MMKIRRACKLAAKAVRKANYALEECHHHPRVYRRVEKARDAAVAAHKAINAVAEIEEEETARTPNSRRRGPAA